MEALCILHAIFQVSTRLAVVCRRWLPRIKLATSVIKLAQALRVKQYDFQWLSWRSLGVSLRCGIWDFFGSAGTLRIFLLKYLAASGTGDGGRHHLEHTIHKIYLWSQAHTCNTYQYHTLYLCSSSKAPSIRQRSGKSHCFVQEAEKTCTF